MSEDDARTGYISAATEWVEENRERLRGLGIECTQSPPDEASTYVGFFREDVEVEGGAVVWDQGGATVYMPTRGDLPMISPVECPRHEDLVRLLSGISEDVAAWAEP